MHTTRISLPYGNSVWKSTTQETGGLGDIILKLKAVFAELLNNNFFSAIFAISAHSAVKILHYIESNGKMAYNN
jgi:hypothetical protein